MTDAIEKVTLENAAEQLKAKIRTAFVELLPEEQWKEMVRAELKRFTEESFEPIWQGSRETKRVPSIFASLCREVFSAYVKEELKKTLASSEWQGIWGNGNELISEAVKKWCTDNRQALIEATIMSLAGTAAQQVIGNMRHQ